MAPTFLSSSTTRRHNNARPPPAHTLLSAAAERSSLNRGCAASARSRSSSSSSLLSAAAASLTTLPWSFKILFAMLTDGVPIRGYRRRPYMVVGWSLTAVMLLVLACVPLPEPYYCIEPETGAYLIDQMPCNPAAAEMSGVPTLLSAS